jgi:Fur family ferric uptake transcriptional regulator
MKNSTNKKPLASKELGTTTVKVHRSTKQRSAVIDVLNDFDKFLSAQDIFQILKVRGETVGLATVYRALQAMVAAGEVDVIVNSDGEALYRQCGQNGGHHHHIVCRDCGLTVEVSSPQIEKWVANTTKEFGFTDIDHTMDIFGVCSRCAKPNKRLANQK